jgi:DNA-binding Xre family transcriptional regulator
MAIHSEVYWLLLQKQLDEREKIIQEAAAQAIGVGKATFNRLATDQAKGVSREVLDKLRAYFGLGGQTRLRLAALMAERDLTDMALSQAAGVHPTTVKLMVNDLLDNYDFDVLDRLCAYFQAQSLEELLDTGGVLTWQPNGNVSTGEKPAGPG